MQNNIIRTGLLSLLFVMLLAACGENESDVEVPDKDARLSLIFRAESATDGLTKGNDSEFSSLAIYVFDKQNEDCEYSEFLPDITPEAIKEYQRVVAVTSRVKVVYAIGNYAGSDKSLSVNLDKNTTMQDLEDMIVTNRAFSGSSVFMVGKKEIVVNNPFVEVEVPMKRLVARLDIYVYKNNDLKNSDVKIVSIEFANQVVNSRCNLEREMVSPVKTLHETLAITTNTTLQNMSSDLSAIIPENAHASFYSYQNIIEPSAVVDDNITPYLLATVNIDGKDYKYKGYITDNGQTTDKYSLNRNTVYRVIAMVKHPDNELSLNIIPLPWAVAESQVGGQVKEGDYTFDAYGGNDSGATAGIVYFPYVSDDTPVNETSYANYSFKLTAPVGVVWTATITNGLGFSFGNTGVSGDEVAVSRGIAREKEYLIRVGATKSWSGVQRSTYMYITVNGEKLKINPLQSDNKRKFPGSNDTDILVTQMGF